MFRVKGFTRISRKYLLEQLFKESCKECFGGMCRRAVIFKYGFLKLLGVEDGDAQRLFRITLHIQNSKKKLLHVNP